MKTTQQHPIEPLPLYLVLLSAAIALLMLTG